MPISALPMAMASKEETTYKTDAVPTGAANAILLRDDPSLTALDMTTDERTNAKAWFGHNQTLVASVARKLSFSCELAGGGTPLATVPAFGTLLRSCGLAETVVAVTSVGYAPVTAAASMKSSSHYFHIGDKQYKMVGSRGNVKAKFTAGKIPLWMFDFTGLLPASNDVIDDTGYLSPLTLTAWKEPQVVNFQNTSAFSVHGFGSSELYSLEIDLANQIVYRNKPNAEDVTIVGRKPTINLVIGEPTLAQKNFYTNMKGAILDVLSLTHGVGAGKVCGFNAPKMQIESIDLGAEDNVRTMSIKGRLLPNAGNDELTALFT